VPPELILNLLLDWCERVPAFLNVIIMYMLERVHNYSAAAALFLIPCSDRRCEWDSQFPSAVRLASFGPSTDAVLLRGSPGMPKSHTKIISNKLSVIFSARPVPIFFFACESHAALNGTAASLGFAPTLPTVYGSASPLLGIPVAGGDYARLVQCLWLNRKLLCM
jgi:hypothetical protein